MLNRRRRNIQRARIDVPCVVFLRRVLEELQLVAARLRSQRFEVGLLLEQARDAAGLLVDRHAQRLILERERIT